MIPRHQIVDAARSCLKTRWMHQGRKPGVGIDCAGLVYHAGTANGLCVHDCRDYSRMPDGESLVEQLLKTCDLLPSIDDAKAGSVLVFQFLGPKWPQHLGIMTDRDHFIHAYYDVRRVVETRFDEWWRSKVTHALDYKGVC